MKTKLIRLIPLAALACLLTGCAGTRTLSDVALGGGGGAIAGQMSDGNPVAIGAGAAGGVLLSEGIHYVARKEIAKSYQNGYEKGRSDAVKQQYWLYVSLQRTRDREDQVRLYQVNLPEQTIDGVIFKPTSKLLRIEE